MEKKYRLAITLGENGKLDVSSSNDGFNAFELLGFLDFKANDIREQIKGNVKPDIIERTVIKNKIED